jgi:F-type H+-transporting ATPase subunit gamma
MESLRDIRTRIKSVNSTQQVTRAMKMVAAAKLRKAQEGIFATRPYAFKLREIINQVKGRVSSSTHPLFEVREEIQHAVLVVVTGDRGLAGAFNTNVIKKAEEAISGQYAQQYEEGCLSLVCLGRKGHDHFAKEDIPMIGDYRGLFQRLTFNHALEIVDFLIDGYLEHKWDEVSVVYNEFRNTIAQNRIVEPFLPLPEEEFVTPVMEKSDVYQREQEHTFEIDYLFEPNAREILHELLPRYLNFQMWRILLESNAAEQGARMVAMDNATTNAGELLRELRLNYNRARQAAITTEIVEISSGAEALASQE